MDRPDNVPATVQDRWAIDLKAGEVHYLGRLVAVSTREPGGSDLAFGDVQISHRGPEESYHLDPDAKHEIAKLEATVQKMDSGPWREVVRARLAALRSATRFGG